MIPTATTEQMTEISKTIHSNQSNNLAVIICAAGSSTRMGGKTKKEYLALESGTVLSTSLKKFLTSVDAKLYVITIPKGGEADAKNAIECDKEVQEILQRNPGIKIKFIEGGETRQESVFNAMQEIFKIKPGAEDWFVIIHDGARPFVSKELILRTLESAIQNGAAVPGIEPTDTIKEISYSQKNDENFKVIHKHLERSKLICIQTPQIFDFEKLYSSYQNVLNEEKNCTDDSEIFGGSQMPVSVVEGEASNLKITYPDDLKHLSEKSFNKIPEYRVGNGYDLHRLVEGRKLVIGGVEIPFEKGEDGHSDGDVLLHAITDAVLGAARLGDIGSFFPPDDDTWKDADSKMLLKTAWEKVQEKGYELQNLDCVIKLEKPKFLPYREQVIKSIADVLGVSPDKVFVKAKTYEKTSGWEGKIEATAICLINR